MIIKAINYFLIFSAVVSYADVLNSELFFVEVDNFQGTMYEPVYSKWFNGGDFRPGWPLR